MLLELRLSFQVLAIAINFPSTVAKSLYPGIEGVLSSKNTVWHLQFGYLEKSSHSARCHQH